MVKWKVGVQEADLKEPPVDQKGLNLLAAQASMGCVSWR